MKEEIIKDGKFEYIEKGEGPVILVIHGLFGALSNFKTVFAHFSENYKVVIPMMPLYTMPVINTNVKNLAEYIKEFIEYKNFDKVNLLGNSLGGHVALIYAKKHFSKVNTITLTGSSGLYESSMGGTFPRREDYNFIKDKVALTFFDPIHATKELVDECFETVNNRAKAVRILALAKSAMRHNVAKDLPNLHVPTCLIWGKNDTITPPEVAEEFNELLPAADLFWIDECGHVPMMEHPDEFNNKLGDWLSDKIN